MATINIDQTWLDNNGPAPYFLSTQDDIYVLQLDVDSGGVDFIINNTGITLDLNGYTATSVTDLKAAEWKVDSFDAFGSQHDFKITYDVNGTIDIEIDTVSQAVSQIRGIDVPDSVSVESGRFSVAARQDGSNSLACEVSDLKWILDGTTYGDWPLNNTLADASLEENDFLDHPDPPAYPIPEGAVEIDSAWLIAEGDPPYVLDIADEYYYLAQDVSADGPAFVIDANGITFNLNSHTVEYDKIGGGAPNSGFELGTGTLPDDWDLTGTTGAETTSTYDRAAIGRWYLRVPDAQQDQRIVSGWTDLRPSEPAKMMWVRDDSPDWHKIIVRIEAEHSTLGVIAAGQSWHRTMN